MSVALQRYVFSPDMDYYVSAGSDAPKDMKAALRTEAERLSPDATCQAYLFARYGMGEVGDAARKVGTAPSSHDGRKWCGTTAFEAAVESNAQWFVQAAGRMAEWPQLASGRGSYADLPVIRDIFDRWRNHGPSDCARAAYNALVREPSLPLLIKALLAELKTGSNWPRLVKQAIIVLRERKMLKAYVEEWLRIHRNHSAARAEREVEVDIFRGLYGESEKSTFQWDNYTAFALIVGSEFWDRFFVKPVHQPFFQRKIPVE